MNSGDDLFSFVFCFAGVLVLASMFFSFYHQDDKTYAVEVNGVRHENMKFVCKDENQVVFENREGKRFAIIGTFVQIEQ